jgi:CRP/FNR family cyclic AMP-dependent transcriptional regulator
MTVPEEDITRASALLTRAGPLRVVQLKPKERFFSQGEYSQTVYYLQKGRGTLSVLSRSGKQATITRFAAGDFVGEDSLADEHGVRMATATAITVCSALEIEREAMIQIFQQERACSELFLSYLLTQSIRLQQSLVDQRLSSSAKRLAKTLLLMAEMCKPGREATLIPHISQAALAEMIGVSRSRVNFLLKHFSALGHIDCRHKIKVRKSLINILLDD